MKLTSMRAEAGLVTDGPRLERVTATFVVSVDETHQFCGGIPMEILYARIQSWKPS